MDVVEMLRDAVKEKVSDIIFSVGAAPVFRIQGRLKQYGDDKLNPEMTKKLVYSILSDEQKAQFEEKNELDLSISLKGIGRFRVNVYKQKGYVGAAFRTIMEVIPALSELGMPDVVSTFTEYPNGLVLVTGPTGSGKSTTLASMIDLINSTHNYHIVTVEDPIEFVHEHKQCIIDQRQLGRDTNSYANALKYVLRQDPDVILCGEMRDLETIAATITLAETGHLVFSTLHTQSAAQTIDRVVDVFPPYQQEQIRTQLSLTLKAVISQQLLPKAKGGGRVAAREIMVMNSAIANLIREGKTYMILNSIQTGKKDGMVTMEESVLDLLRHGEITPEIAQSKIQDKTKVKQVVLNPTAGMGGKY
ncbi:MAG: type IV pilus twitching motility protein PilT [Candidatus Wallbacteria bacterium]|nr:type IV pilus twitching motility protein PilT [Candidatus Wallbacteria bacterium]